MRIRSPPWICDWNHVVAEFLPAHELLLTLGTPSAVFVICAVGPFLRFLPLSPPPLPASPRAKPALFLLWCVIFLNARRARQSNPMYITYIIGASVVLEFVYGKVGDSIFNSINKGVSRAHSRGTPVVGLSWVLGLGFRVRARGRIQYANRLPLFRSISRTQKLKCLRSYSSRVGLFALPYKVGTALVLLLSYRVGV